VPEASIGGKGSRDGTGEFLTDLVEAVYHHPGGRRRGGGRKEEEDGGGYLPSQH